MDSAFWNSRYEADEFVYGLSPNLFLKEQLDLLRPGKLLLPGEGEGRNALYAAQQGWNADAFDQSEAGRQKAEKLKRRFNVSFNYFVNDVSDFDYKSAYYDAAGLVFFHLPPQLRDRFHEKLIFSLRKGGILIAELFHKEQAGRNTGGPKNPELLYSEEELLQAFAALHILLLEKKTVLLEEGPLHDGEAVVLRMVAQR